MTEADRKPPTASPYQIFMLVCSVLVLVALVVELASALDPEILRILFYADTAFCVVFFADFLLSLARAEDRKRYMLTWGWIDLLSSLPAITELRAFRIGRVLRILRFLRAARAARVVGSFWMGRRAQTTALVGTLTATLVSWVIRPREDAKDRQLNAIRDEIAAIRALLEAR